MCVQPRLQIFFFFPLSHSNWDICIPNFIVWSIPRGESRITIILAGWLMLARYPHLWIKEYGGFKRRAVCFRMLLFFYVSRVSCIKVSSSRCCCAHFHFGSFYFNVFTCCGVHVFLYSAAVRNAPFQRRLLQPPRLKKAQCALINLWEKNMGHLGRGGSQTAVCTFKWAEKSSDKRRTGLCCYTKMCTTRETVSPWYSPFKRLTPNSQYDTSKHNLL